MMELLGGFDPLAITGVAVAALLILCIVALFLMRDSESAPPRVVSRPIWCTVRRERATVDFVERIQTGLRIRTVQGCLLRSAGAPCNDECCDLLAVDAQRDRAA